MSEGAGKRRSTSHRAWGWTKTILIALAIWLLLRALLIQAFRIPSSSMEETLLAGDFLFVNKALYGADIPLFGGRLPAIRAPRRLDLVVFDSPEMPGTKVVKRIVGVPGDTLRMEGNQLCVNGVPIEEPYASTTDPEVDPEDPRMRAWQLRYLVERDRSSYRPTLRNWGPIVVPPDSFFVMGDNRDYSYDSRYWGFLALERIAGRALLIYYSYDRASEQPLPFLTAIRWSRIFSAPH